MIEHAVILPELISTRLAALSPAKVEVRDDSAQHAGHVEAKGGGGHYSVLIVSPRFHDLNRIKRHQLVYDCLRDLMPQSIHALSIRALTPEEI